MCGAGDWTQGPTNNRQELYCWTTLSVPGIKFFGIGGTEVWTQGLVLTKKVFYHLSHALRPSFDILN
jgi:hypothetical protein